MGRIPDHLLRLAQRVAEGRWVTIGAKADPKRPGKRKGGTPVELDGEGVIQKGPSALTGKRPSELSQSHLFTGQPHKSQRKLFAEPGDPVPPPRLDPEAKPQAQAPAKKEPKPKAKKPQNMSLLAVIRREGGISGGDFEHADFREHGLLGALNKNGFGIDDMAAMLVRGGHIIVPHGVSSPGDHLLQLLKKKTNSLLADKTSELEKDYEAYARAREEALADGHQERELEEVRGRGQEAGADAGTGDILEEIFGPDLGRGGEAGAEEPGDLAGDAAEPASGVDTSFDFGPAAAPKVEEKPKAAKPRKPKQKKDWEDKQEEKHQKALADVKAADAEKAAVAAKARELLGKVTDPGQKAELQKLIDRAEGKQAEPEAPPALDKADDQRPKIGDTIKTRLGGSTEEQPDFEINLMPATKPGHFAIGQGSIKQREIPLESFENFIDDMTGKVSVPADSGVAEIDAVASGKAKHLGRGDDGSAFQVGDKVVKTSTVSPFIPTNPGHRTPQEGLSRLHDQTMTHNKLAEILKEKGVGGVEPLEWHEHGGRGFAVSNLLDTKAKLNAEQIAKVRNTVDAIHDAGYVVGDDIQVGLNKNGDPVIYDLGKARKLSASDREAGYELEHDSSKFTKMAKQNGHEDALPLRSDLVRQIDRLKNSTSKMGEKLRAKFQDQLDQLDAKGAKPSQAPEQKTEDQLRDEYRKAKAARQAADNSDNPEDAFHADDALWNAEQALKKAGLDPAKGPQQSQGPAAPPKLNLFGQPEPTKPQPATTQGLFGEQVPVEDKKAQPQPTAADDAAKGLDWLDQKQDRKTDGTGEMFGGLFSPGQQASQGQQEPVAPPPVEPEANAKPKVTPPAPKAPYAQRRGSVNFSPVTGPTGHKLVGYNWEHDKVDTVDDRGENRTRKVSAWDRATQADETNRPIVHNFTVQAPDGTTKTVSLETAARLLGFDASGEEPKAKFQSAVSAAKTLAKLQMERAELVQRADRWKKDKADVDRQVEALPDDQIEEVPDTMGRPEYRVFRWKNQPEISIRRKMNQPDADREEAKRQVRWALADSEMEKRGHKEMNFRPNTAKIDGSIKRAQEKLDELTKQASQPVTAARASTLTDLALQKAGVAQNTDDAGLKQAGPVAPPKVEPAPAQKPKATDDEAGKHVDAAIKAGDADEYWDENQDDPKFTKAFNQSKQQFLQSVSQAESSKAEADKPAPAPTSAPAPTAQAEPQQAPDGQQIPKPDYQTATGEEIANYMGQFNGWTSEGQANYAKALDEMPKEAKDRFYAHKNELAKQERAKRSAKTKAAKKAFRQQSQSVAPELQPAASAANQSEEVPPPPPLDTPAKGQSGYVNARASAVGNMGEDLPNSIRARRGVDKNQNLATIDKAIETHGGADLGSKLTDPKMTMSVLAAHLALKALPKTMNPVSKKYVSGHHPYSLEQAQSDLNSVYAAAKQAAQQAIDQKQDALKTTTTIKNAVMDAARKINNESPEGWRRWTNPVARHILDNTDKQLYFRNKNGPFYKSGKMFEEFLKNNVDGYDRSRPLAFYADQAASDKWADSVKQLVGGADAAKIGLRTKKKMAGFKASDAYLNNGYKRNSPHAEFTDHNQAAEFLRNQVGLRGKNFGNTMSDRERAEHLNKTAGAFQDLADVTGLPQRAVSMNGKLALGLGSHGHGGFDSHAATYFPSTKVMNLTRKAGMGSLAHEWAHALDHELNGGKTNGGDYFLTSNKSDTPLGKALGDLKKTYADWEARMRNSDDWKYLNLRKRGYWSSPVEMFARAFEKYAQYKLAQSGRKNNYLSGVGNHAFWPSNEDMAKIAPAMEKVLELAKNKLTQQPATESARIRALLREVA